MCIHGIGITPDVVVERVYPKEDKNTDKDKDKKDKTEAGQIFEDLENKEKQQPPALTEEKKKELELKKKDMEDNQLQTAVSVIKGIKIYRGFSGAH